MAELNEKETAINSRIFELVNHREQSIGSYYKMSIVQGFLGLVSTAEASLITAKIYNQLELTLPDYITLGIGVITSFLIFDVTQTKKIKQTEIQAREIEIQRLYSERALLPKNPII